MSEMLSSHDHGNCELCDLLETERADVEAKLEARDKKIRQLEVSVAAREVTIKTMQQLADDIQVELRAVEAELVPIERVLALAMYREQLNDANHDVDNLPHGLTTNFGELDYRAEVLIRTEWAKLPAARQSELLHLIGDELAAAQQEQEDA